MSDKPSIRAPKNLPSWCFVRLIREPGTDVQPGERIRSPADVHRLLGPRLSCLEVEAFYVVSLGSQSHVRAIEEVSRGQPGSSSSTTTPQVIRRRVPTTER